MMKSEKFSFTKRIKSFSYAFNGFKIMFQNEHNSRIHLVLAVFVVLAGVLTEISRMEWIAISFAISLVFICEIINTAIEYLANFVSPDYHELIKKVKDLGAAAVLLAAINSVVVGLFVFVPKIILLFT